MTSKTVPDLTATYVARLKDGVCIVFLDGNGGLSEYLTFSKEGAISLAKALMEMANRPPSEMTEEDAVEKIFRIGRPGKR